MLVVIGAATVLVAGAGSPLALIAAGLAQTQKPAVIAYTQLTGRVPHVWTINVSTHRRRQLTFGRYGEDAPSWSPNGQSIAYAVTVKQRVPGLAAQQILPVIAIRNLSRGSVRTITSGRSLDETPAWSPAGGRIAFVRTIIPLGTQTGPPPEIWTIGTDGHRARQLTHNRVADAAPAWSPTGRWIAYQRARNQAASGWDLWTMRENGSRQRLLARGGTRPAWSPNGQQIAFGQPTGQIRGCCQVTNLMVIGHDGRHRRLLVKNGGRPSWSPDGSRIVFQRMSGSRFDLWIVNSNGTGLHRLTHLRGDEYAASWRPS